MSEKEHKPIIGITIGDINGVGPEVIIKTFCDNRMLQDCTPVIYGSSKVLSYYRKAAHTNEFNYNTIKDITAVLHKKINLINCWEEEVAIEPGTSTEAAGKCSFKSLDAATRDLLAGNIDAMVTAPINKHNIQQAGFRFVGHTEYLAEKSKAEGHLMFMVSEGLRVALVTGHVPLKDAASQITVEKIVSKLKILNKSLKQDFGIDKPKIAVLGVNPHAGDGGVLGNEEKDIIAPAVKQAFGENILAYGPYAADGFFGSSAIKQFDAVLAMYHDQGLTPFKALAFDYGVNFTAGLPIVRTSPDHGTGYDIAGKNEANEASFRTAVYYALDILRLRHEYAEITANPLKSNMSKLGRDQ